LKVFPIGFYKDPAPTALEGTWIAATFKRSGVASGLCLDLLSHGLNATGSFWLK